MELAIYFNNGNVAYFKEVKGFEETKNEIKFAYFGQASQLDRQAKFLIENIAGWSLSEK
ncbi:hypothetical protein HMPREF9629_00436 [Peptoanaerobacter stomatis]|uniref:Uncharacterized protein n=1 Tax=Peptoanaerobacter stomatis TaxID=796937 RepID=G9X213_9FIRM|nr:hypothetical protein [Peptoanaerobacter stomatis]EHL13136.1 hypothetical protein HMPREF9629_00436 [Peptoanaerobacter stomatis]